MMKKKKFMMTAVPVLASILLGGCKEPPSHIKTLWRGCRLTIRVMVLSEVIGCFKEDLKELENENLETAVTIRDAAGQQKTQNDQVKELLDEGCNVLCHKSGRPGRSLKRLLTLPESMRCRLFFSTESLWQRIYSNGISCIMWGQRQNSPGRPAGRAGSGTGKREQQLDKTGTEKFNMWCWKERQDIRMPLSARKMQ